MPLQDRPQEFRAMLSELRRYVDSLMRVRLLEQFDQELSLTLRVAFQTLMANSRHPHREYSNYLSTRVLIARPIMDDLKKSYAAAINVDVDTLTDSAWATILLARQPFYRFTKQCEHRYGYTPMYDEKKRRICFSSIMSD